MPDVTIFVLFFKKGVHQVVGLDGLSPKPRSKMWRVREIMDVPDYIDLNNRGLNRPDSYSPPFKSRRNTEGGIPLPPGSTAVSRSTLTP